MHIVSFIGQRGGQLKSTLSRLLATEAARSVSVRLADLDYNQGTSSDWSKRRAEAGLEPAVPTVLCRSIDEAFVGADGLDLLVIDCPGRADQAMLEVAKRSTFIVQPTGAALDDLLPSVRVFHTLIQHDIPADRLGFVLTRISTDAEAEAAREYLSATGYRVLPGYLYERAGYRAAQNSGRALTEARYPSLRAAADTIAQTIIDAATAA